MRRQLRAGIAAAAMLAGGVAGVRAQSIEAAQDHLVLGRPLALRLLVRGFEIDPGKISADCVQVHIWQGETDLTAPQLDIQAVPLAQDGQVLLQVSSAQPVVEPVVRARVQLRCGADFSKELALFAEPAAGDAPRASARSGAAVHPGPALGLVPRRRTSPPDSPGGVAPTRSPPAQAATAPSPTPLAAEPGPERRGAQLRLEEASLEPLVTAVLSALSQRHPELLRAGTPARADTGVRPIEADWLRELHQLQEEQRQARAQLAALQLRLERQESGTLQRWGAIAAVVAGLLAAALALRLAREHILPRLGRNPLARGGLDTDASNNASTSTATADGALNDEAADFTRHPEPRTAPVFEPPWQAQATPDTASTPVMPRSTDPPPLSSGGHSADLPWPATPSSAQEGHGVAPRNPWAGADFGEPHLEGSGFTPALQQVDQMITDGFHGAAATILEHALQARPGKSPWLLLRLLDLYARMQQPQNRERVAAQLEALYNLSVPHRPANVPPDSPQPEGPALDDSPELLDRLCGAWLQPSAALDWLRAHLLRDRGLPPVALATFRDLLFLYDLARLRETEGETAVSESPHLAAHLPA